MKNSTFSLKFASFLRKLRSYAFLTKGIFSVVKRRLNTTVRQQPVVIVLSLGSKGSSATVAAAAQRQGYRVVIFCAELPFAEARFMDGYHRLDCTKDFDRAEEIARCYEPVAILVEGKNRLLPMQNKLAQAFGLIAVGDPATKSSNSKINLRECIDQAGLPNMPWSIFSENGNDGLSFPLVSKPDVGTSSLGVQYLENLDEFQKDQVYWEKVAGDTDVDGRIMFEAYIDGRQFDVEGVCHNGEFHVLTVVEQYYQNAAPYFPPSWFLFNPPISENERARLEDRTIAALKSFGVQTGGWHCESRISDAKYGRGEFRQGVEGNEIYVLDYANRMGYNQLVSESCGVDFAEKYVETMLPMPFEPPQIKGRATMQIMIRDEATLRNALALKAQRPAVVQRASFVPFEFSAHMYFGHIVLSCTDFRELYGALAQFDLVPDTWAQFYPDAIPAS